MFLGNKRRLNRFVELKMKFDNNHIEAITKAFCERWTFNIAYDVKY